MQVCWWLMGASDIHFQTHKTFFASLFFAECTSLKYQKNGDFSALHQHCGNPKTVEFFWGKAEIYSIMNLLRILRLFLLAVVGGSSFACGLMFSGIYAELGSVNLCDLLFYRDHCAIGCVANRSARCAHDFIVLTLGGNKMASVVFHLSQPPSGSGRRRSQLTPIMKPKKQFFARHSKIARSDLF